MAQPLGLNQAAMPEPCLLQLSTEAKEAPYNEAATLAVEFFVTAEKAILGSLQAFCTFLGKVHETGTFSSWSSEEENVGKCSGSDAQPCESLTKEGTMHPSEDCCQLATVNYELSLTPFSFPATFCEQFIKETFTFTVVRTQDLNQDGAQRKDTQTKTSAKSDGREKGGKRAGPPRSIIPPGESRVAEMPVGALLLLKEGERMQPPEGVQEVLATIPDLQKPQPNDAPECTAENAASAVAPAAGAGAAASASATPVVSSGAPASESKGACAEIHLRGESSSEGRCSTAGPFEYFARAQVLGKVLETEPRKPTRAPGTNSINWNAGFLCFWGPSVEDQNELKDFIEERRLEIELLTTDDLSEVDQSNLYPDATAGQCKSKTMGRPLLKQTKTTTGAPAKARRATAKALRPSGGSTETPSNQFQTSSTIALLAGAEPTPFRPPHGVASFCLSALTSCRATHLSFCADVLPVAGYVARKEGSGTVQLCRTTGPDFMNSGTQISLEIRLAEPLFQLISFVALPDRAELNQETEAVPSSVSVSISLPQQGINRLFFAAPLWNKVAAQAKQLQRKEEGRFGYMLQGSNSKVGMKGAAIYEGDVDILTGFLIADGRHLYGVLEGPASGRLAEAAELLLAAAREDEANSSQILYNSRLRFSDRRYCVDDLLQEFEMKAPLKEIMTPTGLQGKSDSNSLLAFSGLQKLQMATLLSRAADLKCQDLFPTSAELKSIRQLNFQ